MAKSSVGAVLSSEVLILIARTKKECIENKNNLKNVCEDLLNALKEYASTEKKAGKIKKRIKRLEIDRALANADGNINEVNRIQKEIDKLNLLEKKINDTINNLTKFKESKNSDSKKLNSVLTKKMKEIYKENNLCPYCHGKNSNCGFFSEESSGNSTENSSKSDEKKDVYDDIKRVLSKVS